MPRVIKFEMQRPSGRKASYKLTLACGHIVWRFAERPPRYTKCERCAEPIIVSAQTQVAG